MTNKPTSAAGAELRSPERIDFTCRVCGIECAIAPDPPARAVCPVHCEDHDYRYERDLRGHFCFHCGEEAPPDLFED